VGNVPSWEITRLEYVWISIHPTVGWDEYGIKQEILREKPYKYWHKLEKTPFKLQLIQYLE